MYDSATIANRFLVLAEKEKKTLTPMQVLKLVYIAHGWALGLYGVPLTRDEIEAWQYGPVIPELYNRIRTYKSQPVNALITTDDAENLTARDLNLIDQVFGIYGNRTGAALSRITHAEGTPWQKTYKPGTFGLLISNDLIEDHYNALANKAA